MANLVLTRPIQQAAAWQDGLSKLGHSVNTFPLIEISACSAQADQAALNQSWEQIHRWDAIMFVSHSAVQVFFKQNWHVALTESAQIAIKSIASRSKHLRFWVTGPGTLASLQAIGIASDRIDSPDFSAAQFDSEALWRRVAIQIMPGKRVLIVRGRDVGSPDIGRDWLARQISAQGGDVNQLVVYERRSPIWSDEQLMQCQTWLRDGSIWLFSSSQALRNLPADLDARAARCVCTHERIAESAKARGFAVVYTSRPTLQEVAGSIKSMHE